MPTARTTLILDGNLLKRAKSLAAQRGTTLSQLVSDALRESLATSSESRAAPPFRMTVFGSKRRPVDHSPADFAGLDDADYVRLSR
jgi:hypothetical protein